MASLATPVTTPVSGAPSASSRSTRSTRSSSARKSRATASKDQSATSPMTLLFRREVASMLATPPPSVGRRHPDEPIELLAMMEIISSGGSQQSVQLHRVGGEEGETWVTRTEGGREWFPRVGRVDRKRVRPASDEEDEGDDDQEMADYCPDGDTERPSANVGQRSKTRDNKARDSRQSSSRKKHKRKDSATDDSYGTEKQSSKKRHGKDDTLSTPVGAALDGTVPQAPRRQSRRETISRRQLDKDHDHDDDEELDSGDETERERQNGSVRGRGSSGATQRGQSKSKGNMNSSSRDETRPVELGRGKRRCAGRNEEATPAPQPDELTDDLASLCGRVNDLDVWSNVGDETDAEVTPLV